jgi:hypothetical protein
MNPDMQTIPVDVRRLGALMCVVPPELRVTPDGDIRTDREGRRQFTVGISVRQAATRRADVIEVVVSGESPTVAEGQRVRIEDLVAVSWAIGDRHGTSFRAAAVTAADDGGKAPTPPANRTKGGGAGDDAR